MNDQWDDNLIIDAYERSMSFINKKVNNLMINDLIESNIEDKNQTKIDNQTTDDKPAIKNDEVVEIKSTDNLNKVKTIIQEKQWREGDYCLSLYEDGILYEAKIIKLDNDKCTIRYLGYENEELKRLDEIQESAGEESRKIQIQEYLKENAADLTSNSINGQETTITNQLSDGSKLIDNTISIDKSDQKVTSDQETDLKSQQIGSINHQFNSKQSNLNSVLIPPPPINLPSMISTDENELLATTLMSWYMSGYHTGYYQAVRDLKRQ